MQLNLTVVFTIVLALSAQAQQLSSPQRKPGMEKMSSAIKQGQSEDGSMTKLDPLSPYFVYMVVYNSHQYKPMSPVRKLGSQAFSAIHTSPTVQTVWTRQSVWRYSQKEVGGGWKKEPLSRQTRMQGIYNSAQNNEICKSKKSEDEVQTFAKLYDRTLSEQRSQTAVKLMLRFLCGKESAQEVVAFAQAGSLTRETPIAEQAGQRQVLAGRVIKPKNSRFERYVASPLAKMKNRNRSTVEDAYGVM